MVRKIRIRECPKCGMAPEKLMINAYNFFLRCPNCGLRTEYELKMIIAIKEWNKMAKSMEGK